MITITKTLQGFNVDGHAGFADAGKDIVCAAVSAVIQTTMLGIKEYTEVNYNRSPDFFNIKIDEKNRATDILINTMFKGLSKISDLYPEHVQVKYY